MERENKEMPQQPLERALLVGVDTGEDEDFERSMEELGNLAKAACMEPVGVMTQSMDMVNKGLYIGTGKVEEVKEAAGLLEADIILFDNALSPSQLRNLQKELEKPILDRTTLILDIFDTRAKTREAKLQVEAARLQYLLPRLVGLHDALTRQGGSSGSMSSRGAGEKKLELDRRRIEHRLSELHKELEQVSAERRVQRKRRRQARIPQVSLVGYTNAGKSTILNGMVEKYVKDDSKKVLEQDMLFATLETTVRRIETGNSRDFLLSDTVGFIHKLPHGLVKAFRSTLEEVKEADLLLHVVDYSDTHYREQIKTTEKTLGELEAGGIPVITVYNKADKCKNGEELPKISGDNKIYMSAKDENCLSALTDMIIKAIYADFRKTEFLFPYDKGNVVSYLRENAHVTEQEYLEEGIRVTAECHLADIQKYAEYQDEERNNG